MPNDLDKQIRIKIRDIMIVPYPTAMIYSWNALSHQLAEWPGLFRTSDFATSGKTHGWIIKRSNAGGEWKTIGRDRRRWTYDIWGFYGFRSGRQADNSDNEFAEICDTMYEGLKAEPRLAFDGTVEMHELLQFVNVTTMSTGEETLHFAQGRLTALLCC